jgi:type II secretory pathway pseudopilin PulG
MKNKKGFTVIELVVYMAILATVSIVVVGSIIMLARSFGKIKVSRALNETAKNSIERMVGEIRYANGMDVAGSIFGSSPGKIKLNTTDRTSGVATTTEIYLSGTVLNIKEGSGVAQALTPSGVSVSSLIFRNLTTATSSAVKMEIVFNASSGRFQKTENFYDTIILRQSY